MNILYFITHDTGRFLGCYDRPISFSPNLDEFASEGVQFDRAYCSAPCCGPSRACVMTGQHSHNNGSLGLGSMGWPIPLEKRTLIDEFNDAGFETVHFGFSHERLYGQMRYAIDGQPGVNEHLWNCDARVVADNAIDYLKKRKPGDRPFFINAATNETHASHLLSSERLRQRHDGPVDSDLAWVPPTEKDTPKIRARWANFYASLQYVDHHFGRILQALEETGLDEETLVVFTTDHGTGAARGKRFVYETGVEIALLVRPPRGKGYATGVRVPHLIQNIDYFPTFLEAVGAPLPEGLDGRSFWSVLEGKNDYRPHEHLFIERNYHGERDVSEIRQEYYDKWDPQRVIRTPEFAYYLNCRPHARKRLHYAAEMEDLDPRHGFEGGEFLPEIDEDRPAEELYDLRHDPWEQNNVAGRGEYAAVQRDLAAKLEAWMKETDDPALTPDILPPPLTDPVEWPIPGSVVEVKQR